MENVLVAASNLYAVVPIYVAANRGQPFYAGVLCMAMGFSLLYHMIEHHKHGMTGLGSGTLEEHDVCINLDRFWAVCAVMTGLWMQQDIYTFLYDHMFPIAVGLQLLFTSERTTNKRVYILTHSLWHIAAFHMAYRCISL